MTADSILTVGSIAIDWLEMPDGTQGEVLGGAATYFTLSASQFAPVHVVGVVGTDFPQEGHDLFRTHAANMDDLQVVAGKTFRWGGRYHENWENRTTLFTELGVFGDFKPVISQGNRSCPLVFLANIQPSLQLDVLKQMEAPRLVITDTMNLWIDTALSDLKEVIVKTDILLLNDNEAEMLTGLSDPEEAGRELCRQGPKSVVVKLGSRGALLVEEEKTVPVAAFSVDQVVDPTGAGDSFAGGLVGALAAGKSLIDSLITGSAIASFTVESFGPAGLIELDNDELGSRILVVRDLSKLA
ncbi:MAG: PfkB family carbohydrate kinase [Fidelibacterota bacterium]